MFLINLFQNQKNPKWWIEIKTTIPQCLYYFGPFDSYEEAQLHLPGYIEDLIEEKAINILVSIKKCQPNNLTTCSIPI